jgi:T5SS/PEP-CTERM-associated repeat protein
VAGSFQTVSRIYNSGSGDRTLSITGADPVSIGNFGTFGQLEVRGSAAGTMRVEIAHGLWLNGASTALRVLNDAQLQGSALAMGAGNAGASATFEIQGATASARFGNASIGTAAGSVGNVQLADHAQLTIVTDLQLGAQGMGTLELSGGASLHVGGRATLANTSGSDGAAMVNGAGSSWEQDELVVGNQGTGTLFIDQGAQVTTGSFAMIGAAHPGTGFVRVSSGGRWDVGGELYLGAGALGGAGTLIVDADGTVSATRIRNQPGRNSLGVSPGGVVTLTDAADPTLYNRAFAGIDGRLEGNLWNQQGGLATGAGTITGNLVLDRNSAFSPGASPGTLAVGGDSTWWGGAHYLLEVSDATGTAGVDWDLVQIAGNLDLAATASDPFSLELWSFPNGEVTQNFDPLSDYSWQFASSAAITGFDAAAFAVNTSKFANASSGTFSVRAGAGGLYLDYLPAPVPEPATVWLLAAGCATLLVARGRLRVGHGSARAGSRPILRAAL